LISINCLRNGVVNDVTLDVRNDVVFRSDVVIRSDVVVRSDFRSDDVVIRSDVVVRSDFRSDDVVIRSVVRSDVELQLHLEPEHVVAQVLDKLELADPHHVGSSGVEELKKELDDSDRNIRH
jgi:hypothetical protein